MPIKEELFDQVRGLKPYVKKVVPRAAIEYARSFTIRRLQRQIAADPKLSYRPDMFPFGMNLIGPVDAATGLGQSFRLVERVVADMQVPYLIHPWSPVDCNRCDISGYQDKIRKTFDYSINLWHVSPLEFVGLYSGLGRDPFDHHYNIAYWLWELEDFPDEWAGYDQLLDEIWTPSEFISKALRKKVSVPVYTIPYWISAEVDTQRFNREWFHLPKERTLFLMMYDYNSVTQRKNPDGVIKAFRKAFPPDREDVELVIKAGSLSKKAQKRLSEKLEGYQNISIIGGTLSKVEVNSLIACCDAVVSLHRAEGFGLVLAEAMYNGVPVIATDWSANTEFMNRSCACMVPYHMVELKHDISSYKKGSRWANPNWKMAAYYMTKLSDNKAYRKRIGRAGQLFVKEQLSKVRIQLLIEKRLDYIKAIL